MSAPSRRQYSPVREAYVVDAVRTPVGKRGGALSGVHPADLGAAALQGLLGRNAIDQSMVTGWGDRPLENPYHRFWCHQANPKYPPPPPGILSGGPNSGLQDPYVQAAGLAGCAPQKCFVDNIEAWSANEMAINWNAPLAWVAAFLDEKASGKGAAGGKAKGKK